MAIRRRALSPSMLVRSRAISRGIFGPSRFWRVVAVVMFGRRFLKRLFGKNADYLATEELTAGQLVQIEAIAPQSRRDRRGARRRGA
jgi:hypothetical protein